MRAILLFLLVLIHCFISVFAATLSHQKKLENPCITEMKLDKRIVYGDTLYLRHCNLQDDDMKVVRDYLNSKPELTWLNVINNNIHEDGAKAIAETTYLETLDLDNNFIGNEGAKALAETQNINLKYISLWNNQIDDKGVEFLANNKFIKEMQLDQNPITKIGAKYLKNDINLKFLQLCNDPLLKDEGASELAKNISLETLFLENDNITNQSANDFANSSIKIIDLSHNPLTDKATFALAKFRGESLALIECQIEDKGVQNLSNNHSLSDLYLDSNQITDASIRFLADVNTTFSTISLENNQITDKYLNNFIDNPKIMFLNLGHTQITDAGVKSLTQNHNKLTCLYLDHNQLTNLSAYSLTDDPILYVLSVTYNHIGKEGIEKLKSREWLYLNTTGNDGQSLLLKKKYSLKNELRMMQTICERGNKILCDKNYLTRIERKIENTRLYFKEK